jgi:hypothetical protein
MEIQIVVFTQYEMQFHHLREKFGQFAATQGVHMEIFSTCRKSVS